MVCFVLYSGWLKLSLRLIDPFGRTVLDDISWDLDWIIHRNFECIQKSCEQSRRFPREYFTPNQNNGARTFTVNTASSSVDGFTPPINKMIHKFTNSHL